MRLRTSPKRTLLALAGLFCLPMSAEALLPFDTTDPTSRTVVIWIDNNVTDPSSVGQDLEFAFNGSWTSNGTTGTIVVDKDDVISAFALSGLPGTPADTVNWSDMTITFTVASGVVTSMSQTGTLAIAGLGNQPFSYDLNSTLFDTITSNSYTQTGFADVTFGPETFTGWCTDTNAGQISGLACPAFDGPTPFPYNSSTGQYSAIGATDLNSIIFAYSTFGEGQLFEVPAQLLIPPGLSPGDRYRLVYITSNTHTALSTDISVYDQFVQDHSNDSGIGIGSPIGDITWRAIGSTASVDAIDHVAGPDPIYRLDGVLVSSDSDALWDGDVDVPINVADMGIIQESVFTGTDATGVGTFDGPTPRRLGDALASLGHSSEFDGDWVETGNISGGSNSRPFYAISDPLPPTPSVPALSPWPTAGITIVLGLAGLIAVGARRRQ